MKKVKNAAPKGASMEAAVIASHNAQGQKKASKHELSRANRRLSWVVTNSIAVLPFFLGWLYRLIYGKTNPVLVENAMKFIRDFAVTGSFLWLAVSTLVASLFELILYGIRVDSLCARYIIATACVFVVSATCLYILNIGMPIRPTMMVVISGIVYILFIVLSYYVSFKMVKEV